MSREYLDRRRDEIMAAALRCFAREGFHRTTMQHIVAESGHEQSISISAGFGNKPLSR